MKKHFDFFATKGEDGEYDNLYPSRVQVWMCGSDEPIVPIHIEIVDTVEAGHEEKGYQYGFYYYEEEEVSFIYEHLKQVQMVSPDFFQGDIKRGVGIFVKLRVTEGVETEKGSPKLANRKQTQEG